MNRPSKCSTCADLSQLNIEGRWQDLQTTAKTGCETCDMLIRGVKLFEVDTDSVMNFRIQIDLTLYIHLTSDENQSELLDVALEFYTEEGQLSRWRNIGPGRHVAKDLRDNQSVALMKRWLSECRHAHPACRRDTSSQLPTRLIAVGASNEEMYLHLPAPEERAEYVALSHCWGQHRPLVTNNASLGKHQQRLEFDKSSKLFAEAGELTRNLGFQYIWIDSLCIIQDSEEDWSKEATNMTDVFNNAVLTLFAHSSQDSSCSLYSDTSSRNQSMSLRVVDQAKDKQETRSHCETIFVRQIYKYPHQLARSYHSGQAPKSSFLAPRGWVLQEELLSPRSLHFHAEEMSWTCSSFNRCECRIQPNIPLPSLYRSAPDKSDRQISMPDNSQTDRIDDNEITQSDTKRYSTLINLPEQEGERTADLLKDWPNIVMEFSHRLLSKLSDKLPALTGLAGYIQKASPNERFVGGLWLSDLSFQLLWSRDHLFEYQQISAMTSEAQTSRQKVEIQTYTNRHLYSATWSWISLPGHAAIHYPTRHMSRSPMERSNDYAQSSHKSVDHFSHFVKPLLGDSDFVNIVDMHIWVRDFTINSWGPGLLTLVCRCIFISVSTASPSEPDGSEDSAKESTNSLFLTAVDRFGQNRGSWPSDVDLASFKFDWDFPIFQDEMHSWTIDKRLTHAQLAMINKWREYRNNHDEADQPTDTIRESSSPSPPSIALQQEEKNVAKSSTKTVSERSFEQEKPASNHSPVESPTFALMLAGVMTWVYNFTPKRLEGVCLVLEEVDKANNVYRRVGHVTGVGSVEAWVKDVPKQLIHIV